MKLLTKLLVKVIIELERLNKNVRMLEAAVNRLTILTKKSSKK